MSRVALLSGYLVIVFLGGALVAPWLWWGVQAAADHTAWAWMDRLANNPFHRYVHRCVLILALAGLYPLARGLGCRSLRDVGLARDPKGHGFRRWAAGIGLGFAMFAVIVGLELALGMRVARETWSWNELGRAAGKALTTALIVGVLEEILFRGVLCGGLRRVVGWVTAIVVSSFVYSAVHFFARPPAPENVSWLSGVMALSQMMEGLTSAGRLYPGLVTLFLAGTLLAVVFRRTGTLWFSMGLHSGWVFWIKMRGWMTHGISGSEGRDGGPVSGWLTLCVVTLVLTSTLILERLRVNADETQGRE